MKLFTTPEPHPSAYLGGVEYRGFKIVQDKEHFLYSAQSLDRAEIPHGLTGRYTSLTLIKQSIDDHLEKSKTENA